METAERLRDGMQSGNVRYPLHEEGIFEVGYPSSDEHLRSDAPGVPILSGRPFDSQPALNPSWEAHSQSS